MNARKKIEAHRNGKKLQHIMFASFKATNATINKN